MDKLFASIGHNLRRIADPSGRESNILFWPYAILVAALNYIAGALVAAPIMMETMQHMAEIVAEAQRRGAEHDPSPMPFDPAFMPDVSGIALPSAIILAASVALLFSAVARRLHDRDRTGLWGLMPLPFAALGIALTPYAFHGMAGGEPDPALFVGVMLSNLLNMAALIGLIVLLVGKGSPEANRFGPAPA
jgi:uncharacterized membrane protein YhaH (DUF805 family)